MNGELRRRAVAIIDGADADPDEKLDLLLGITLDTHSVVEKHEGRLTVLEVYPTTIKRLARFLVWMGAVAAALLMVGGALVGVFSISW